jgi:hypothetical protein
MAGQSDGNSESSNEYPPDREFGKAPSGVKNDQLDACSFAGALHVGGQN